MRGHAAMIGRQEAMLITLQDLVRELLSKVTWAPTAVAALRWTEVQWWRDRLPRYDAEVGYKGASQALRSAVPLAKTEGDNDPRCRQAKW